VARGCPKGHFEENQISPGLIRLLLLPTAHPKTFQRLRVRSSASCYRRFNLAMGRSPGFGSAPSDIIALFRLAFASAPHRKCLTRAAEGNSPVHYAKGTRSPVRTKSAIGLPLFVGTWFQVLLTPLAGVLFTFQSPYLCTIGRRVVLSLGGWTPQLHTEFHELRATLVSRW
jgi:hypothetical protein